ncbi:MAG: O-antigen ligase family protein [Clostridium sp.]|nr:O-antigen ligase family protein [Clostridium sp.]
MSALWSPNLVLSAYRAVECIGLLLLNMSCVCYLIQRYDYRTIMLWSVTYAFLNLCLTFAAGIIQINLDYALYKCQFPATIFFYLAFYCAPKKYIKYPMMLIAFLCKSVTGYCGMVLGMCSFMFGNRKYRIWGILIAFAVVVAMSTMGTEEFLNSTIFASKGEVIVNGQIDENKTSGRSKIWENANEMMVQENRQWHGFGFVVGEMMMARELIGNQVIGMHNGFLSAYVGTGYIGLFLFILFMAMTAWLAYRNHIPKEQRQVLIACICVILVHTYGNPGLGFRVYGTWMPAMFIVMLTIGMEYKSLFLTRK